VLTPVDIIEIIRAENNPQKGAQLIKEKALDYGSTDNISVIVIDLRNYTRNLKLTSMKVITTIDYAAQPVKNL